MSKEREAWEIIARELPPGWTVENSGDMDYMQNWSTRAAEGTVTERGFCGREYAVEDCWEQFGITRRRYAELIAVERVREVADAKIPEGHNVEVCFCSLGRVIFDVVSPIDAQSLFGHGQGPTLCDAAWACIPALGGGE